MARLTGEYFEVTARPGEGWDLLAHDYLGDVRHQNLVIEDDGIDEADLPPWKRSNPDYSLGVSDA